MDKTISQRTHKIGKHGGNLVWENDIILSHHVYLSTKSLFSTLPSPSPSTHHTLDLAPRVLVDALKQSKSLAITQKLPALAVEQSTAVVHLTNDLKKLREREARAKFSVARSIAKSQLYQQRACDAIAQAQYLISLAEHPPAADNAHDATATAEHSIQNAGGDTTPWTIISIFIPTDVIGCICHSILL